MKKILIGIFLCIVLGVLISAAVTFRHLIRSFDDDDNDISLHIKENDHHYRIYAKYERRRTLAIQRYLDSKLGTHHMFRKSRVDATITLDDQTHFHVRNTPGRLVIKFNRDENSEEAYWRMKELAEGLKTRITAE